MPPTLSAPSFTSTGKAVQRNQFSLNSQKSLWNYNVKDQFTMVINVDNTQFAFLGDKNI